MKLFTKEQRNRLLDNGRKRPENPKPVVKLFDPTGASTWLFTELDENGDTLFGLADLGFGFPELGYCSLDEISAHRGRFGLGIERDLHFEAKHPISVYAEAARNAGRIVESGAELDAAAERHTVRAQA